MCLRTPTLGKFLPSLGWQTWNLYPHLLLLIIRWVMNSLLNGGENNYMDGISYANIVGYVVYALKSPNITYVVS